MGVNQILNRHLVSSQNPIMWMQDSRFNIWDKEITTGKYMYLPLAEPNSKELNFYGTKHDPRVSAGCVGECCCPSGVEACGCLGTYWCNILEEGTCLNQELCCF